jgi:hypothetical protein
MTELNKINFYISNTEKSENIYERDIEYNNNKITKQEGKIKNKFAKKIIEMNYLDIFYLKNIKKNEDDKIFENYKISKNKEITEDNYKDYIRKNGIITTTKGMILRTLDNCRDIDEFMKIWINKMNKYDDAMINIYYYGYIYEKKDNNKYEKLSCYILCDKYGDYEDVIKLCLTDSISYLKSYLRFLKIIVQGNREIKNETNAICTNLRLYNYGLGRDKNKNAIFILLEFNEKSIIFRKSIKEEIGETKRLNKKVGISYIPYYVANDYFQYSNNWIERLDKLYSVALFELLMYLFYKKSRIFLDLYLFITNVVEIPYGLQYEHVISRYVESRNKGTIYKLILNLEIKYKDLDNSFSKYITHLILSILSENYENIPYPENIFKNIEVIEGKETSYSSLENEAKEKLVKEIGYIDKILDQKEINNKIHKIIENATELIVTDY